MMIEPSSRELINEFLDSFDIDENDPDLLVKIANKAKIDLRKKNSLGEAKLLLWQKFSNDGKNKIAQRWLKESADDGYVPACTVYANTIYYAEKNKDIAFQKAESYLSIAREHEFPYAFYLSAKFRYERGMHREQIDMLRQGANLNCVHCCSELGRQLYEIKDNPEITKMVFNLLLKAADLGHHGSAFDIGAMYEKGDKEFNVSQDLNQAVNFYKYAINGDPHEPKTHKAMHNLAALAFNDLVDTGLNLEDALSLYKKAVELGSVMSLESLGRVYLFGEGVKGEHVEKNIPEAIKWLTKASQHDSPQAKKWLEEINKFYN